MALPINIDDLINCRTVESERIEFKEGWNPEEVIRSLCAFANDINNWGGGYVVVGIRDDNGRPVLPPVGLNPAGIDKIQKDLLNLCNRLKPAYFPVAEPVVFHGKHIFIIWAPGGQNRPYQAPVSLAKQAPYAHFIRRFSSTVRAKIEDERELIELAANVPFDDRINHKADIGDLNLGLIQSFLQEIGSSLFEQSVKLPFEQICGKMMIVDGPPEYLKPRNVALMFFNERPHDFFPYSRIELVHFKTSPAGDEMSEKNFEGPIHRQLRNALNYIQATFIAEHIRKVPQQAEALRYFNYPYEAIEEALVNAIYHRSYEIREPVEVRIHPDRIEILSFPGPDRSVRREDIATGNIVSRRYRNRRIGEFLKELELTEGKATGIPRIKKAMCTNGSPEPVFDTDDDRTYFLTVLPVHADFLAELPTVMTNVPKNVPKNVPVNERQLWFLEQLSAGKQVRAADIAAHWKVTEKSAKRDISNLKSREVIEFVGALRNGYYRVKS